MPDNTFDVVSKIELPEVLNAVQQALKEVTQRYDLKDSHSNIELNEKDNKILLASKDEFKLKAVVDILQSKLVKRHVPLKGLQYGEIIPSAGSTVKQEINLQQDRRRFQKKRPARTPPAQAAKKDWPRRGPCRGGKFSLGRFPPKKEKPPGA